MSTVRFTDDAIAVMENTGSVTTLVGLLEKSLRRIAKEFPKTFVFRDGHRIMGIRDNESSDEQITHWVNLDKLGSSLHFTLDDMDFICNRVGMFFEVSWNLNHWTAMLHNSSDYKFVVVGNGKTKREASMMATALALNLRILGRV